MSLMKLAKLIVFEAGLQSHRFDLPVITHRLEAVATNHRRRGEIKDNEIDIYILHVQRATAKSISFHYFVVVRYCYKQDSKRWNHAPIFSGHRKTLVTGAKEQREK